MGKISKKSLLFTFIALSICFAIFLFYLKIGDFNDFSDKYVNGIYISRVASWTAYNEYGIDYYNLVKKATTNDTDAIRTIVLLNLNGKSTSAFIYHSAVIIGLIELVGEDKIIYSLRTISKEQQLNIWLNIYEGMGNASWVYEDYPRLTGKSAEEAFPKIYAFIHE